MNVSVCQHGSVSVYVSVSVLVCECIVLCIICTYFYGNTSMFMRVYIHVPVGQHTCVCMLRLEFETRFSLMTLYCLFLVSTVIELGAH